MRPIQRFERNKRRYYNDEEDANIKCCSCPVCGYTMESLCESCIDEICPLCGADMERC